MKHHPIYNTYLDAQQKHERDSRSAAYIQLEWKPLLGWYLLSMGAVLMLLCI